MAKAIYPGVNLVGWLGRSMHARIGPQGVRIPRLWITPSRLLTNSLAEMTSEEVTAQRRKQRKQFKLDRAQAIAAAAAEAEAAFSEGRELPSIISADGTRSIPSAATWKPQLPETPASPQSPSEIVDDEPLVDVEHLQLTLVEAFFLLWSLECLTVCDAIAVRVPSIFKLPLADISPDLQNVPMTLQQIWTAFQIAHEPFQLPVNGSNESLVKPTRFDNPFLINYVVYHHYRALGWVVKGGIKFCVDYLLYKRGPVFHHAEYVCFHIGTNMTLNPSQHIGSR